MSEFGGAWKVGGCFGVTYKPTKRDTLMVSDPVAIHHILHTQGYLYPKTRESKTFTGLAFGRGVSWAADDTHVKHRKLLNPAFTTQSQKAFFPVFRRVAALLTERWKEKCQEGDVTQFQTINVNRGLVDTTLDIIGEAVFDYHFGSLDQHGKANEFSDIFHNLWAESNMFPPKPAILFAASWAFWPEWLLRLVEYLPARQFIRFREFLIHGKKLGKELVVEKAVGVEKGQSKKTRDILSILALMFLSSLVDANESADVADRLPEDEVLSQVTTLLFAGHETTACTLTWLMYELANHPEDQQRIRDEITEKRRKLVANNQKEFNATDFESMNFLNACIKEALRYHPISPWVTRESAADDVIPLSEPVISSSGAPITQFKISKHTPVLVSTCAYNRHPSVWGADADVWNPRRHLDSKLKEKQVPVGVFSNLLTFSGGYSGCIGWRFALTEMQSTVIELVENFEFAPPTDYGKIKMLRVPIGAIMAPMIDGRIEERTQMPLGDMPSKQLVWLITGTTSGFGQRLVAAALARNDLVIATARSSEKLQEVYGDKPPENLRLLQLDITAGFESIKQIMNVAAKIWDRIDVLVNNAGNGYLGFIEESGSRMIREQFETNIFGVVDVTNAVLPYMRARKQGTVVVIGSRSVWRAETPGLAMVTTGTYAASKAAIHAITESLAAELSPFNIKVLLVAPGAFRTEGIYSIPFNTSNPIPDYDSLRNVAMARYNSIPGTETGDPTKGMQVLVDVIRGEGCAEGKKWPGTLLLGEDAERDLRKKWDTFTNILKEWGDVVRTGSQILREAVADPAVSSITVLSRRALPDWLTSSIPKNDKTTTVIVEDFLKYPADLPPKLAAHDACIWALGGSSLGNSEEEYKKMTYDFLTHMVSSLGEVAKIRADKEPFRFVFVSAAGANPDKSTSKQMYGRVKREAELYLLNLPAESRIQPTILRPGYFYPEDPNIAKQTRSTAERAFSVALRPLVSNFWSSNYIPTSEIAQFALKAAQGTWGTTEQIFNNDRMRELLKNQGK
ncbi:hypothetical protein D9758_006006 [Tetrapyrgos nigripes]|uniref:Cytochrome P450 n=1 Tax=Tetrapyrgos nigripes TaxID=182062 RepID=A0A8H5G0C5_9AGAR|nr:hypothetical protein D9758_006006 [Tetrapyrgos nigripes]